MKKTIANRLLALVMALSMLVLTPVIAMGEGMEVATRTDLRPLVTETVPTAVPTEEATPAPTPEATPAPEAEPAVEPAPTPSEETKPTDGRSEIPAEPTPEVLPDITARITSNLDTLDYVGVGTEMVLTVYVEGNGDYAYTVQWQMSDDMGETWQNISGENGDQLRITLKPEHDGVYWRAVVELVPHSAT